MKIAFFDCYSGISGDMCLGALIDAGVSAERLRQTLGTLPVSGWELNISRVSRGGITATKADIKCSNTPDEQIHRTLPDVLEIIKAGDLPPRAVKTAEDTFRLLAEAEARVHNCPVNEVHFHEVGAVDAIIDITGTSLALCQLGIEKVYVGEIAVGGGKAKTMHGLLPVPAPATVELLSGFKIHGGPVQKELATPTGAALLRCLATGVQDTPKMSIENAGYGAGSADFENISNTLRVVIGSTIREDAACNEEIWVIEANIDDMTGEEMGFLMEQALAAGALDAYVCPVQMKKSRTAFKFTLLSAPETKDELTQFILEQSTTLGVRFWPASRTKLGRETVNVTTPWGDARVKVAMLDGEVVRAKPEFDDCSRIASSEGITLRRVRETTMEAYRETEEN